MNSIVAIIVLYNPDISGLKRTIDAVLPQVDKVYLVDNSDDQSSYAAIISLTQDNCSYLTQKGNSGVGAAINRGVEAARGDGARYVLLLDQDSVPDSGMVSILLERLSPENCGDSLIGAIGPGYSDTNGQEQPCFVVQEGFRIKRVSGEGQDIVSLDHLITSGSLIPLSVIDEVGLMNEELFIDYIDTEWCLRAKAKGFIIAGSALAHMEHSLGDATEQFWGHSITVRSPQRCYYTIRNGFWLLKQSYVPWGWFVADLIRLIGMFVVFSFLVGNRRDNFFMMAKGMAHGLFSQLGDLNGPPR